MAFKNLQAELLKRPSAAGAHHAVPIAGNGHVDRELGVPRYPEAAGIASSRIRAVGYLEAGQPGSGRFDERIKTRAADREDACKAIKR